MKLLIIGGSGFVSGTLAHTALAAGHEVWAVTRGNRALAEGVKAVVADRADREGFAQAIAAAGTSWDTVVDCIGFQPEDAQQDLAVFEGRAGHLIFISTDFVFDPAVRTFPQGELSSSYSSQGYGYNKRRCELELAQSNGNLPWTVFRPCHIYGPGSLLGCLPTHGRDPQLIDRLKRGEALKLVGGGHFLQQPIFAADLAQTILSSAGHEKVFGKIYNIAGPDIVESAGYYRIIADVLGVELKVEELPVADYLAAHPDSAPFLCHRVYDLGRLKADGLMVPSTPLRSGLEQHVRSILDAEH